MQQKKKKNPTIQSHKARNKAIQNHNNFCEKTTCDYFDVTRNQQNVHKLNNPIEDYLPTDIE